MACLFGGAETSSPRIGKTMLRPPSGFWGFDGIRSCVKPKSVNYKLTHLILTQNPFRKMDTRIKR